MCSILVVVADVLFHKTFQVPFVEHDHMVEQIPATVADKAFCNPVLPRTMETGSLRLDAEDLHRVDDFLIEVCTAIEDQVAGSRVVRECLAQMLNDPGAGRMPRHIEAQNTPPVMSNDERRVDGDGRVQGRRQAARTISYPCDGDPGFAVELKRHTAPIAHNYIARFLSYPCHLHLDPFKRRVQYPHRSTGNRLFREYVPRLERLTQFHFDSFRGDRPNLWETELQMRSKPLLFKVVAGPPQMGEHLDKVAFDKFRQHETVKRDLIEVLAH